MVVKKSPKKKIQKNWSYRSINQNSYGGGPPNLSHLNQKKL